QVCHCFLCSAYCDVHHSSCSNRGIWIKSIHLFEKSVASTFVCIYIAFQCWNDTFKYSSSRKITWCSSRNRQYVSVFRSNDWSEWLCRYLSSDACSYDCTDNGNRPTIL